MVHSYLKNGRKEKHFNVLLGIIRNNESALTNDFGLLIKVSKKAGPANRRNLGSKARKK